MNMVGCHIIEYGIVLIYGNWLVYIPKCMINKHDTTQNNTKSLVIFMECEGCFYFKSSLQLGAGLIDNKQVLLIRLVIVS